MKVKFTNLLFFLIMLSSCSTKDTSCPVSLTWQFNNTTKEKFYENSITVKNESSHSLDGNWAIYFTQFPRRMNQDKGAQLRVEEINANFFKIVPTEDYTALAPGDSIQITYYTSSGVPNVSHQPEGFYWTKNKEDQSPLHVPYKIECTQHSTNYEHIDYNRIYTHNERIDKKSKLNNYDILPSVKKAIKQEGQVNITHEISLVYEDIFKNEAKLLQEKLSTIYGIQVVDSSSTTIKLTHLNAPMHKNREQYKLEVSSEGIEISGINAHGVFNGCQTLLALFKGQTAPYRLECVSIEDYPDLVYRGQMLDVARNFTTIDNVKKLIDILASYKINVLHLHLTDDEGWRIEIPGLEELTSVSARRGHTLDESNNLYPSYDGAFDANGATTGNGYYTKAEFIDLLQYATARHIRVIPEVDCPGHSRAAIVAMNARYNKYIDTDPAKAKEYLLCDFEDKSEYRSAQAYTDNVMNVALPSTYTFIDKVFSEIAIMYQEAGLTLPSIHIGGDEVPKGAWLGSPLAQTLMQKENLKDTKQLSEYFFQKAITLLAQKGLKFDGWQEVALHNPKEIDKELTQVVDAVYCWNTVPEYHSDIIPYSIANNGYKVVLCNVNNFYLDLAYSPHPEERGLSWAGYVDETKAFSMLPFSIYKSARTKLNGDSVQVDFADEGKVKLQKEAQENILGIQAQLFSETIRSQEWVEYYVFPKILGLVERGWNAHPQWEYLKGEAERAAYYEDLSSFYKRISTKEFPYLNSIKANYRIPHAGILLKDNMLYLNSPLTGAIIRYTTDGTEPNAKSEQWTEPIKCLAQTVKAKVFFLNKESVTSTLHAFSSKK